MRQVYQPRDHAGRELMDWRERVDASDSPNPSRSVIQSVKIGFLMAQLTTR